MFDCDRWQAQGNGADQCRGTEAASTGACVAIQLLVHLIFCVESQIHADANAESDEDAAAPPKPLPSEETKLEKEELDFRRNARELRDRVNADPEHEKTAVEELVEIKGQLLREERYSQSLRTQLFELQVELQQHADFKNDYNIKYVESVER